MPRSGAGPGGRARRAPLALLCGAQILSVADATLVTSSLPDVGASLDIGAGGLRWVTCAYALALAALLLPGGRAADLAGPAPALAVGLAAFAVGALAVGTADTSWTLLAGRAVQGAGVALIAPATIALAAEEGPGGEARARALGLLAGASAAAAVIGAACGGIVADLAGWRALFIGVAGAALCAAAGAGALAARRVWHPRALARLDLRGAMLAATALAALVLAADAAARGRHVVAVGLAVAAAAQAALFARWERRAREPLVRPGLARRPGVMGGIWVGALQVAATLSAYLAIGMHLRLAGGCSPLEVGLAIAVMRTASLPATPAGAALARRGHARRVLALGGVAMALGLVVLASVPPMPTPVLAGLLLTGAGIGALVSATTLVAAEDARRDEGGIVGGLLNAAQWAGGAVGVAATGALLGAATSARPALLGCAALAAAAAAAALAILPGPESTRSRRGLQATPRPRSDTRLTTGRTAPGHGG